MRNKIFNTTHFWILATFYATYFLVVVFDTPQFGHLMMSLIYGGILSFVSLFFMNVLHEAVTFFRDEFLVFLRNFNKFQNKIDQGEIKIKVVETVQTEATVAESIVTNGESIDPSANPVVFHGFVEPSNRDPEEGITLPDPDLVPIIKRGRGRPRLSTAILDNRITARPGKGYRKTPPMGAFIFGETDEWKTIVKQYNTAGEIFLILLTAFNKTTHELADGIGYKQNYLCKLITGNDPINKNIARRLAEYFPGFSEAFWMNLKPSSNEQNIRSWKVFVTEVLPAKWKNHVDYDVVKNYNGLGSLIRKLGDGLTEEQLAADIGISLAIVKWIKADKKTSYDSLKKISQHYDINLQILTMLCYKSGHFMTPLLLEGLNMKERNVSRSLRTPS
jgi:plasmid maintenance system antidote protein VapI